MKISTFIPTVLTILIGHSLFAQTASSVWITGSKTVDQYSQSWEEGRNSLKATILGEGTLSAVRKRAGDNLTFTIDKYRATADLKEGDYWLLELPIDGTIPKGGLVEVNFTMVSQPRSPKYYIVEVLDGKKWKSDPGDLRAAQEDPTLLYSVRCSGYGDGVTDQHSMYLHTFRLTKGAVSSVKIRIRAVGPYTCWGDEAKATDKNWSSFVDGPSSAIHIAAYEPMQIKDTTKVLCIGNSFTYVNGPTWMLKEIALSQGHLLDMKVAMKGGQTLGQHIHLSITAEAIERDSYEYVFLQDQSQSSARVGKDPFIRQDILNNAEIITSWIRKYSPQAKIFSENTWSYKSGNYGGYSSFEAFDSYAKKGAKTIRERLSSTTSPISDAFAIARNERPDINLYYEDNMHQSEYGAYLKACVNYLMLFNEDFNEDASSCNLDPEKAQFLRKAASRAVRQND